MSANKKKKHTFLKLSPLSFIKINLELTHTRKQNAIKKKKVQKQGSD